MSHLRVYLKIDETKNYQTIFSNERVGSTNNQYYVEIFQDFLLMREVAPKLLEHLDHISVHEHMYTNKPRKNGKYVYKSCVVYAHKSHSDDEDKFINHLEIAAKDIVHIQELWDLLLKGNISPRIDPSTEQISPTNNIKTLIRWFSQTINNKIKNFLYIINQEINSIN